MEILTLVESAKLPLKTASVEITTLGINSIQASKALRMSLLSYA